MAIGLGAAALLGGGSVLSSFLSGIFGASEANKERERNEQSNARAREYLADYGYEQYESPYNDFFNNIIDVYGGGNLTAGQESQLQKAGQQGAANIATVMANRGGTIGGQLAMTEKLNDNLASQRLALADSNVNTALNLANQRDTFNLSDWLTYQQGNMRQKELLAQYA